MLCCWGGWVLSHLLSVNFPRCLRGSGPTLSGLCGVFPVPFLELQRHPPCNTVDESENSLQSQLSSSSLRLTPLPRDLWMDDLGIRSCRMQTLETPSRIS